VITDNQLMQNIWGGDAPNNVRYLRTWCESLLQRLEPDPSEPKLLISESGVGYRLKRNAVPRKVARTRSWASTPVSGPNRTELH
jgi:hypothetical protein